MRLHLTGASGFLGRELAVLSPGATTERVEVRDREAVAALFARLRPDAVIHTAYRQDGEGAYDVTATGAGNVAAACAALGARLVHLSTDVVFDGRLGRPYVEEDEPCPCTAYGEAKAHAERFVVEACPGAVLVRTSLIVGGPGHAPSKHELVARDPAMAFFSDELRCPIQVTDLARALLELVALDVGGPLHVVGPDAVSRAELAALVVGHTVTGRPAPAGRPLDCRLDARRARALLRTRVRGVREVFG